MSKQEMKTPSPYGATTLRRTFTVSNPLGIHARPAAWLVRAIEKFHAQVIVERNNGPVNGRSVLGLLMLAAGCGTKLTFTATGKDAKKVLDAIQRLFESDFAEGYKTQQPTLVVMKEHSHEVAHDQEGH